MGYFKNRELADEFGRESAWGCPKCAGAGYYPMADGDSDSVMEFCTCPAGRKAEAQLMSDPSDLYKEMRENNF